MDNLIEELKKTNYTVHLDKYNIDVKQYLGYDEIDNIIKTSLVIDSFSEREKNIDMLILHYCAGIDIETLESTDPDIFLYSGLISKVKSQIINLCDVYEGLRYEESIMKQILKISNNLPDIVKEALEKEKEQEKILKRRDNNAHSK